MSWPAECGLRPIVALAAARDVPAAELGLGEDDEEPDAGEDGCEEDIHCDIHADAADGDDAASSVSSSAELTRA
eukprot:10444848-Alexandrium_andersonii.AAC.1